MGTRFVAYACLVGEPGAHLVIISQDDYVRRFES
jgi:hypothetical protein